MQNGSLTETASMSTLILQNYIIQVYLHISYHAVSVLGTETYKKKTWEVTAKKCKSFYLIN